MFRFLKEIIIFLFLLSVCSISIASSHDIKFEKLNVEDGLSDNTVYSICQDDQGFMWFATAYGLNRYDGHTFKQYFHHPKDSTSLNSNFVICLLNDSQGRLWVGSRAGLCRYDPLKDCFRVYRNDREDSTSVIRGPISALYEDRSGTLWFGGLNGLNRYVPEDDAFVRYHQNFSNLDEYGDHYVLAIHEDHKGILWIGTFTSLYYLNQKRDQFCISQAWEDYKKSVNDSGEQLGVFPVETLFEDSKYILWVGTDGRGFIKVKKNGTHLTPLEQSYTGGNINDFYEDARGRLWMATLHGIACLYDDQLMQYRYDQLDPATLSTDIVNDIYISDSGIFWAGTENGGVNYFNPLNKKFNSYNVPFHKNKKFSDRIITCIEEDDKENYWLGSRGAAIYVLNPYTMQYQFTRINSKIELFTSPDYISCIYKDSENKMWVGSMYHGGLGQYIEDEDRFLLYRTNDQFPGKTVADDHINDICEDQYGYLWFSTRSKGLNRYNRRTKTFVVFQHDPEDATTLSSNRLGDIMEDSRGNLWIASKHHGFNLYHRDTNTFQRFRADPSRDTGLSSDNIHSIHETRDGKLWICTWDGGLNRWDPNSDVWNHYTIKDGLPSNNVFCALEDSTGNLWLSTPHALVKFNPQTEQILTFDKSDGLITNDWYPTAYYKNKVGEFLFGGTHGFTRFHPDSIQLNEFISKIFITDLKIFNQPFPLDSTITFKKQIRLDHDQNNLTFSFAALNFVASHRNQFAYQMEGADKDYIYINNNHNASYTNLAPGKYTFHVKASNNDGIWNEEGTSLRIHILPPFWQTTWAYLFYWALFIALLVLWRRLIVRRVQMRSQLEQHQFEAQKLREMDEAKSRFFANISHEFRTPLTLILGPVNKMIQNTKNAEDVRTLSMIKRNGQRLLNLINQLLDLSQLETHEIKLQVQKTDLIPMLKGLVLSFTSLAEQKKINFTFHKPEHPITAYLDHEKFEKTVINLISNAFKFTPDGGRISVSVFLDTRESKQPCYLGIAVEDNGPGIPKNQQEKIFNRFYQMDDHSTRQYEGSGIGLSLTKELVELHHGEIQVKSQPGTGSVFTVRFPLSENAYKPEEIVSPDEASENSASEIIVPSDNETPNITDTLKSGKPSLLLVEDNADVRYYIRMNIDHEFNLIEAENGKSGLKMALDKMPDLIISDVMMPEMDGLELCKRIKSDVKTSNIPVILLTARVAKENKIDGFHTGADDYITKPFDSDELLARIKNLLAQRQKLHDYFMKHLQIQPKEIAATSMDEIFFGRVCDILEEGISNPDFDVEAFANAVHMSRQHLNRKLKSITNYSTQDFIRVMRLKRAAQLLEKQSGTVTEIAYEVGFQNPSYFAECFKKMFKCLPSEYQKKNS